MTTRRRITRVEWCAALRVAVPAAIIAAAIGLIPDAIAALIGAIR